MHHYPAIFGGWHWGREEALTEEFYIRSAAIPSRPDRGSRIEGPLRGRGRQQDWLRSRNDQERELVTP